MDITKITCKKELKNMHKFFRRLPNNEVFKYVSYSTYKALAELGDVYKFTVDDVLVGGLFIYTIPAQNNILNYYVPDEYRRTRDGLTILDIILRYIDKSGKDTYFKTDNPEAFKKYAEKVDGEDKVYKLLLPRRGF